MKLITFISLIAGLIQTTFVPLNLVLLIIVNRSLVADEKSNYYLSFLAGVILGIFSSTNLGFYPLFFLIFVKLINLFKKSALSSNALLVIPLSFLVFLGMAHLEKLFLGIEFNMGKVFIEMMLSFPTYLLIRFWDERFIVKPEIKLRIKNVE